MAGRSWAGVTVCPPPAGGRAAATRSSRPSGVPRCRSGRRTSSTWPRWPALYIIDNWGQIAEQLGFEAVPTPTGTWCEDAWLSGGRLLLNGVTGGQADERRRFGDHLSHDERYGRTGEFLDIVRCAWGSQPFGFRSEHYHVDGATVLRPPDPVQGMYFGGSSPAAGSVAARHADVYLTWVSRPIRCARSWPGSGTWPPRRAGRCGFGIRLHVITRDTEADAWAEASRLLDYSTRPRSLRRSTFCAPASRSARIGCARGARPTGTEGLPRTWRSTNLWPGSAWSAGRPDRAGRQPGAGRQPDRGVCLARHQRVHATRSSRPGTKITANEQTATKNAPARGATRSSVQRERPGQRRKGRVRRQGLEPRTRGLRVRCSAN